MDVKSRSIAILLALVIAVAALSLLPIVQAPMQAAPPARVATDHVDPQVAYVTLYDDNLVAAVQPISYSVPLTIDVGAAGCNFPWRAGLAPGGDTLLVSCYWSHNVVFVDTETHAVTASVDNINEASGAAFTWDGSYALIGSRWSSQIAVVNMATMGLVFVNTPAAPRTVAAHPFLDLAYAALNDGSVLVLDTETLAPVTTIPFGGDVWDIAVSPDGQWVYAGDRFGAGLAIIDTATNTIAATVSGLGQLNGIDVAPDGSTVYVAEHYAGVHFIDTATRAETAFVPISNTPWEIAATCDGSRLLVSDANNQVVIVDTTTQSAVSLPLPGSGSRGLVACAPPAPHGAWLWVQPVQAQAALGETVTYTLTLRHLEQEAHTYDLSVTASDWTASLSQTTAGPLAYGDEATFEVIVTIDGNANWHDVGQTTIAATSTTDAGINASARLLTTAYADPDLSITPDSLDASQTAAQVTTHTLSIANGNGVTTTFDIDALPVSFTPYVAPAVAGGPDAFGYTFRDSDEPDGPSYDWEDISASGTALDVAGADDTYFDPVPLNFPFEFYGNSYEEVYAGSNGYLSFGQGYDNIPYGTIPGSDWPNNVVALFGGDRYFDANSAVYYETRQNPTRTVFMFENVYDCCGANTARTFEVIFYPNGNILAQYEDLSNTTSSFVGIENADGSTGLAYGGDLSAGLAICYAYPGNPADCRAGDVPWLTATPDAGVLGANSAASVEVILDARGLQPGAYVADLLVRSDDPASPAVVSVSMDVAPTSTMGRLSGSVSDAWSGAPLTATVRLGDVYTATASPGYTVWAEAGMYAVQVSAPGYVTETVNVMVWSGETSTANVSLEPAQPRLALEVDGITAVSPMEGTAQHSLVISNTGPVPLDVTLYEIASSSGPGGSGEDLNGATILVDAWHGAPPYNHNTLIHDLTFAGATVIERHNAFDSSVLETVDVLWLPCCGNPWTPSELELVFSWLQQGGAAYVQGTAASSAAQLAPLFDVQIEPSTCAAGSTTLVGEHAITQGVSAVYLEYTCDALLAPASATTIASDQATAAPRVVARTVGVGRVVVSASTIFYDWIIDSEDNRLLATNTFSWLATPIHTDVPWLSLDPTSLTVAPRSSEAIALTFNGAGLELGTYEAVLGLVHNDPNRPGMITLPVTLTVTEIEYRLHLPFIARDSAQATLADPP